MHVPKPCIAQALIKFASCTCGICSTYIYVLKSKSCRSPVRLSSSMYLVANMSDLEKITLSGLPICKSNDVRIFFLDEILNCNY